MVEYKGIEFTEAEFAKLLPGALEEEARKGILLTVRTIEELTEDIKGYDTLIHNCAKYGRSQDIPKYKADKAKTIGFRKQNLEKLEIALAAQSMTNQLAELARKELESLE